MRCGRAAKRSPPGEGMCVDGNALLIKSRPLADVPPRVAFPGDEASASLSQDCAVTKPLDREAAHLTRRDGRRRRLVDYGDGVTIEEADLTGLLGRTLSTITLR